MTRRTTDIDTNTVIIPPAPVLSVVKDLTGNADEDTSGTVSLGDTLTYTITANNGGSVTLSNVVVSDDLTGGTTLCLSVAPLGTCVLVVTYVVTQADVDAGNIHNVGTADSDETPPVSDPEDVPVPQNPAILLDKTGTLSLGTDGIATVGDVITYSFTVSNTGNVTLTGVTVTDPLLTVIGGPLASLAVGASDSTTFSGTYAITQGDIDAGVRDNLALASGEAPGGDVLDPSDDITDDDPHSEPVPQTPAILLDKTGTLDVGLDGIATVGDVITYSFTVTNTGNVTLSNVTVSDPLVTVVGGPLASLAPGVSDSTTFSGTYAITQADIDAGVRDNLAVASGEAPGGDPTDPSDDITDDDPHSEPVPQTPSILLDKTGTLALGGDGIATVGDVITYSFTVTNTGNVALSNVTVSDPLVTVLGGPLASLAPGVSDSTTFSGTYSITQADIDAGVRDNLAVASGEAPGGDVLDPSDDITDDDPHSEPVPQTPSILLDKTGTLALGTDGIATVGDVITYSFTVTNTGNVTLSNVTVTDPLVTVVGGPLASLAAGASDSTTFSGTYSITQADIDAGVRDNLALASGEAPGGDPTDPSDDITDDDPHSEPVPQTPSILLDKTGTLDVGLDGIATVGDVMTYSFTVTNTGNVTLSNVTVTDPLVTVVGGPIFSLAVGASDSTTFSGTYAITQVDIDAGVRDNLALASGEAPGGDVLDPSDDITDDDPHSEPVPQTPSILLDKTGSLALGTDGIATVGDVITYSFTVINTGNVTLSNVTVTDPLVTVLGGPLASLAPGVSDSTTFSGTYSITQADIDAGVRDNLAVASGEAPGGDVLDPSDDITDDDPHSEPVPQTPSILLDKTGTLALGTDGIATVGDVITYSFTVTNTGNVTLSNVTVTDPLLTVSGGPLASLAVGASDSTTFSGTYSITQGDIDIALWDIKGKVAGRPVYKMLGGFADKVPVYIAGGYYEEGKGLDDLAAEMEAALDMGATGVKMKIGGAPIREDVERVRVVRETVGPDVKVMVDANCAYRHYEAIEIARKMEQYDVFWFEEPVNPDDYEGHKLVSRATTIPIATGENEYTRYGFRDLIEGRCADIIQPDGLIMGGVTEFMKVAALAQAHDLPIAPHGDQHVHIHLLAAIPNGLILEYYGGSMDPMWDVMFKETLMVEDGYVRPPDRPGMGIEPNEEALAQYRVG